MRRKKIISMGLAVLMTGLFLPMNESTIIYAAAESAVIDVTDYGADPSGKEDSAQAVIDALDKASEIRAENPEQKITIDFPEGTYHIYPDKAEERELYVSNTIGTDAAYKDKKIGILVEDLDNITLEGNDSDFIFHGKMTTFAAIRSENIKFQNFSVDFEVPTVVDITVESVEDNTAVVYIPECYDYSVENGQLHWYSDKSPYTDEYYWTGVNKFENNYPQSIDLRTGTTSRNNELFDNCSGIEDLGNHRVKFSYYGRPGSVNTGMCYQMRPTRRDTPGTFFWLSRDIAMENLDIHYLHGFGMVGQTTENVSLSDVDFRAPEETGRTTAGYADFLQMSGCSGKILVEDCYFANPHDDPINIHGTFQQVVGISSDRREITVRYNHNETAGFPSFAEGDQVEFTRQSDMLPVQDSICTVEKIISGPTGDSSDGINLTDTVIRFTDPIPDEVQEWQYVAENITYTPEVEIRRNIFKQIPTRGILVTTRRPVVIEENIFEGTTMAAVYISCDAQSWYESGRVEDVKIQNNKFYRCQGNGVIFIEPTNPYVSTDSTVHKNIRITENEFYQSGNKIVDAKSVDGIIIENNKIFRFEPDMELALTIDGETAPECSVGIGESLQTAVDVSAKRLESDLYSFNGCKNVKIKNNEYDAGMKMNVSLSNMNDSDVTIADSEGIFIRNGETTNPAGEIYYESSSPETAEISADGKITGISPGETNITAYAVINDKKYASAPLKVLVDAQGEAVYPQVIELYSDDDVIEGAGNTMQFTTDVYPENAQDTEVIYSVEDVASGESSDVAEISQEGILTAKKAGAVLVKASVSNGVSASKLVIVKEESKILSDSMEIINPIEGTWGFEQDDLYIQPTQGGNWANGNHASNIILADPENTEDTVITVEMEGRTQKGYEEAGLVFYKDADNYTAIQRKHANGNPGLMVTTENAGNPSEDGISDVSEDIIYLKLEKTGNNIRGYFSTDNENWILVREVENTGLGNSFKVGILCTCGDGTTPIRFREFTVNKETVPFAEDAVLPTVSEVKAVFDSTDRSITAEYITDSEDTEKDVIRWMSADNPDGPFEILDDFYGSEISIPYELNGYYFKPVVIPRLYNGVAGIPVIAEGTVQTEMTFPELTANSNLESVICDNIDFGEFDRTEKYYIASAYEQTSADFQIEAVEGASVKVLLNGNEVETIQEGSVSIPLVPGINAVEMFVTAEDGITRTVYRYIVLRNIGETEEPDTPSEIDTAALEMAVSMIEKLEEEQNTSGSYTAKSWAVLQTVLDEARTVLENKEATQEQADEAFFNLMTAYNALENSEQKVGLKAAIDGAEAILTEAAEGKVQYTQESVDAVKTVLGDAKTVYRNEAADQETINTVTTRLLTAVTSLLAENEDVQTRLDLLIQAAEAFLKNQEQYTSSSIETLQEALDAAKVVSDNEAATEEEQNVAYDTLAKAITELVRKANKEELANAIAKANEILDEAGKYAEATLDGLQTEAEKAQGVYDKEDATQDEIGEELKVLIKEILEVRLLGDVDGNGTVEAKDAAEVLKYSAELKELTEDQLAAGDVNRTGEADSSDAGSILQYTAEIITEF